MSEQHDTHIALPRLNWYGNNKTAFTVNGVRIERHGRLIHILGRVWSAETAYGVARVLAEMAEAARAKPDPALLDAVQGVVETAIDTVQAQSLGDPADAERIARIILDRFDAKERHRG